MQSNNYEWFITQTVESMLPCFHDDNICLGMKIKMNWDYFPEDEDKKPKKNFRKKVLIVFHRPTNYTKVLYKNITRIQHSFKNEFEMKQLSDHDSCWKSDGMKWVFKSFVEAWDYFDQFGIEGRKIEPMFHYDIFNGAPAYYHLEKLEIKDKDSMIYIIKIGKQIPVSEISQFVKGRL